MEDHFSAILQYADAYARLERLQRTQNALLPIGDQKTGVIAEFYSRIHARAKFPESELFFGTPSQHVWDIRVRTPGQPDHLIQVKSVSAHSQTSRISRIHPGWHELYLLRLDDKFWPVGFWTLRAAGAPWSGRRLEASTMPARDASKSGSAAFSSAVDELEDMLAAIAACRTNEASTPNPLRGPA